MPVPWGGKQGQQRTAWRDVQEATPAGSGRGGAAGLCNPGLSFPDHETRRHVIWKGPFSPRVLSLGMLPCCPSVSVSLCVPLTLQTPF